MSNGNLYLTGHMAPVHEERTDVELGVTGTIPAFLDGRYLRNGTNPIRSPDPATYNWFTGEAMVHGVRLRDGRAEWYRNRWVRSKAAAEALGVEPPSSIVHPGIDYPAAINVIGHASRTFALVEGGTTAYELTDELDTVGPCDFDGALPAGYTAHPLRDPATGELHAVCYFAGWGNRVQYSVLGTDGRIRRTVDIEVHGSPLMHAFTLTERHVVLYDLPLTFNLAPTGTGFPYRWDPDYPARVGVLPRDGDGPDVRWFEVEACMVYHPVNGYEDGDRIVLDVARHATSFADDLHGPTEGRPTLDRWTLDLAGTTDVVHEARLDDRYQEFPRLDERRIGRRHRYAYMLGQDDLDADLPGRYDVLLKQDLATEQCAEHRFGAGRDASEFVFVPAPSDPQGGDEDHGLLMGFVYNAATNRSDLVILDAQTLENVAAVHLPVRVPGGIHGNWIPAP